MSAGAKKVWSSLVREMANSGVLRPVDAYALAQLCEDQALLDELRRGVAARAAEITRKAKAANRPIPGGAMVALSGTVEGRRMIATMRELAAQLIAQRREFGLTPASNSRVEVGDTDGRGKTAGPRMDAIEALLCG
jgi:P27 family predicted phage terminase small subunit